MPRSVVAFVIALVLTGGYAKLNGIWPFDPPGQDLVAEGDGQMSDEECARAYLEAYEAGMGAVEESTGDFDVVAIQECDQGVLPTDLPAPAFDPLPAPVDGVRVLYDEPWTVVEGQWWIGNGETLVIEDVSPSYQRLLESVSDEAAYLSVPGLYGRYRTRLELHEQAPPTPTWCEDIADSSLHMEGEPSGLQMGSFDTFSRPFGVPAGWYRLRYCTEKQDAAATQDEFTGEDYTIYEGRHLLQLWRAPRDGDRTIRIGSAWARALERG